MDNTTQVFSHTIDSRIKVRNCAASSPNCIFPAGMSGSAAYTTSSIYPPLRLPPNFSSVDIYTFLFSPNLYDDPSRPSPTVLTDPYPNDFTKARNWTLDELRERTELCGRMLVEEQWGLQVGKGDVMGLLGWNGAEFGEFCVLCAVWEVSIWNSN